MKHTITVNAKHNQFIVITQGDGHVDDFISFFKELINHPQWRTGSSILMDHRDLHIDGIAMKGIERISHFFKGIGPKLGDGKLAMVMQREIDFGLARAWEILTADDVDIQIEIFRSYEDACHWLAP
jgi:hypothetical protein